MEWFILIIILTQICILFFIKDLYSKFMYLIGLHNSMIDRHTKFLSDITDILKSDGGNNDNKRIK